MKGKHVKRGQVVLVSGRRVSIIDRAPQAGCWWVQPAEGGKPLDKPVHTKDMRHELDRRSA